MKRRSLALANFENLAAIEIAVRDPHLAAPSLGHDPHRLSCSVHRLIGTAAAAPPLKPQTPSSSADTIRASNFGLRPSLESKSNPRPAPLFRSRQPRR